MIEANGGTMPSRESIDIEVAKWVKRSTAGSVLSSILFITWIITFQLNKKSFGPTWFVMSQDVGDVTGW